MNTQLTRREALGLAGLAAAGLVLPSGAGGALISPVPAGGPRTSKRVIRVAHMTDVHVMPEKRAGEGLAACLDHVQSLEEKPELILTGGDSVMDSFDAGYDRTRLQWDLWKKVFKEHCSLPVESAVGNHDVWGWNKAKSKATGDEPLYGKKMAEEMFGAKRYRSLDRAGWHFVILDSIFSAGDGYVGRIDDEQFEWLKGDLAAVKPGMPVLVLTHIPIVSATCLFFGNQFKNGNWTVSGSMMHEDAAKLKDLFLKHRNVKLCLSGHTHLIDRVDFNGVAYLCNGAVSANWWKGPHQECREGYATIDLFEDGTFAHEYHTYGWKAQTT